MRQIAIILPFYKTHFLKLAHGKAFRKLIFVKPSSAAILFVLRKSSIVFALIQKINVTANDCYISVILVKS